MATLQTLVPIPAEVGYPLFDTGLGEFQIYKHTAHLLNLFDTFLPASWASFGFNTDNLIGGSLRMFKLSTAFVDDPKLAVGSHKHLFALVIKVGAFGDVFEIF